MMTESEWAHRELRRMTPEQAYDKFLEIMQYNEEAAYKLINDFVSE